MNKCSVDHSQKVLIKDTVAVRKKWETQIKKK